MRACTVRARRRARQRGRRDQRGAALVMVLLALVVLTVFLTDVQQETSTSFASAIAARDRLRAEYHARSAVNLSRLLISVEPAVRQQVGMNPLIMMMFQGQLPQLPVWEFADQLLGAFNGGTGSASFAEFASVDLSTAENIGLGSDGQFELVIVDEDSKININQAAQTNALSAQNVGMQLMGLMAGPQYDPLFERLGPDGQPADRLTICSAIIDWADFNQDRDICDFSAQNTSAGVEDNVYQTVGLDYFRKNAAFDSLEELRLVQGMSEDFWATFVDPDPQDPKKRLLTVWGQEGKININSASPQVLLGFICGPNGAPTDPICLEPEKQIQLLAALSMIKAFTAGVPLFGRPKDLLDALEGTHPLLGPMLTTVMGLPQGLKFQNRGLIEDMLTNKSRVFSIYAVGVVPGKQKRETRVSIHAVVDFRNANDLNQPNNAGNPPPQPTQSGQPDPQALLNALQSNPAGNVVHFKVR